MKNATNNKWQAILDFMAAFETSPNYHHEQIQKLRIEVAALKARAERYERDDIETTS